MSNLSLSGVSVVVPAFNAELTIARTLHAILAQSILPDEILVVNDGSTDRTHEVALEVGASRVQIIDQINRGVSAARNRGVSSARNELIAFCDADDVWDTHFMETILRLRRNYRDAVAYGTAYYISPPGRASYSVRLHGLRTTESECTLENYFEVASLSDPPLHSSAVAVKRLILERIGGFPETVASGEDLLTWARIALCGPIAYSREVLATHFCPDRLDFTRPSDLSDPVGRALLGLLIGAPQSQRMWLRRYLARWHEMRTFIALGQNNIRLARRHIIQDLRYGGPSLRTLAVAGLCALPGWCAWKAFAAVRKGSL